jgi:toxin ParE1/3/4
LKVVWSPTARARAIAAVDYIAQDRPAAALEWLDGMVSRVEMLSEIPEQGRVVPEWNEPGVREIMYHPYRVIYEVSKDRVEILTLSHQRQQLPTARDKG